MFSNSIGMKLVYVGPGASGTGSLTGVKAGRDTQRLPSRVTIADGFYLGAHEVTQGQYEAVVGENPSVFTRGDDYPVEAVSWHDAVAFCEQLSAIDGKTYRLPTEAEWEYACRAGSTGAYFFGNDVSELPDYAWFFDNADGRTHPVGRKRPNRWGFYDMHGNVVEWCADRFGEGKYVVWPMTYPPKEVYGTARVTRGGHYRTYAGSDIPAHLCQCASRSGQHPKSRRNDVGFRVVCENARPANDAATRTKP